MNETIKDGHIVIDMITNSNAWIDKYGVPGVGTHNNPHIYCAYMTKLVKRWPVASLIYDKLVLTKIQEFISLCEGPDGFVNRWPKSGETSHDEVMGASYHSPEYAERALAFLSNNDGILSPLGDDQTKNVYRFVFLRPYLRACAGKSLSLPSQVLYIASLIKEIVTSSKGKGTSGILLQWLMNEKMERYPLVHFFIFIWRWRLESQGITAKQIFNNTYLVECPIFGQLAQEDML